MATESQKEKPESILTITLTHPFDFGSKHISEVNFLRRPKAKDIKRANTTAMSTADTIRVLANITDLSSPEIEELDLDDFNVIGDALLDFLPRTREIGEKR